MKHITFFQMHTSLIRFRGNIPFTNSSMNDTENGNKMKQKQLLIEVADASDGPLVSSFPGGLPSTEAKFVWKKYNQRHILVGKDDSCRYYGQEEPSRSRLVIALYDKRNHTLTCHMAANEGQVYALQQQVINYETNITVDPTSNVFQEFGSSKKKRALQSQQANRIHSDQILGKAGTLTKMVVDNENLAESNRKAIQEQKERNQNTEVNDPAPAVSLAVQEATNAWRSAFLPNHANPNADTPTKVYTPENMAGPEAWSQVIRVVDACFHEEDPAAALQKSKSSDTWQFSSLRELKSPETFRGSHIIECCGAIILAEFWNFDDVSSGTKGRLLYVESKPGPLQASPIALISMGRRLLDVQATSVLC
ncbi:hypothetical protein FisN_16Hu159 [Fistulifera solaris]|uniref:Uncharacterized protein n=1 Tax=Fistulifera solaris TaxID=1519565 RepID=A0A1Z5KTP6_FISSO|nr:hypothetical protein FisN_16Hu159 [Fistulifera solaris]|eukprot:GAX29401.1 hypothetical protein FisN_16Hu159 [Fistulifera solaris]